MKLHKQNRYNGGVTASRNNPKCYSRQKLKEIQLDRKLSFLRKHLSLESAYVLSGISKNLQNLLKIVTSGDITTLDRITSPRPFISKITIFYW